MARVGVLLVDPDQTLVGGVRQALEGHPYELRLAGSTGHALELVGAGDADVALVSLGAGGTLIGDLASRWPELPVVAVTEPGGRAQGFQAVGAGAWDYPSPRATSCPSGSSR
jgi:DNA-binding NtrC family response regulator